MGLFLGSCVMLLPRYDCVPTFQEVWKKHGKLPAGCGEPTIAPETTLAGAVIAWCGIWRASRKTIRINVLILSAYQYQYKMKFGVVGNRFIPPAATFTGGPIAGMLQGGAAQENPELSNRQGVFVPVLATMKA